MRQDARQNRERILAAAEAVFGASGAEGSTEEVARRAGVGIATVFRHFPTKDELIEAALLRHFLRIAERAETLAADADPAVAWRVLLREMIETGATKLTLASVLSRQDAPAEIVAASNRVRSTVDDMLGRARAAGVVRETVTVDEVYLLVRGLAQATATMPTGADTLDRAIDVVLAGLATDQARTK